MVSPCFESDDDILRSTRSKKMEIANHLSHLNRSNFRFDANSHWKVDTFRIFFFGELEVGKSGEIPRQILMICF